MMAVDAAALRLAALVRSSDDAIVSHGLDGIIESWNPAAERMFGYRAAEAIGRSIQLIVPGHLCGEQDQLLSRIRGGESVSHLETARLRNDGSLVEVALTVSPLRTPEGEVVGASEIARDITERRRMEREAFRLAAIVDSSDDAIVGKDLNGVITSWNRAAERMFGYSATEAIGQSIAIIIPTDRLVEEEHVLGRIRQGLPVEHFETVRRNKNGELIHVSLTVSPIRDRSCAIIGASKIARDISEQRRLAHELEETSRLKDEFLATLSHELRTPLNAIMGYARMLRSGMIGEGNRERAIELIDRNAEVLARLVSDVLDVSRIVAGKTRLQVKRCNLAAVLSAAADVVRPALDAKRLELIWQLGPAAVFVNGDSDRLQQVFWNLLANAVKFTPEGGQVSITMCPGESHVEVAVQDTGIGIEREFLPNMFQRFRQADATAGREFGGLGLGLAIVRHFVELHGGRVSASSPGTGHGATFVVRLPLGRADDPTGDD